MPIKFDQGEACCLVRFEGDIGVACSAELKRALTEALALPKPLQLDLTSAVDLDITAVQLLYAAARAAGKMGRPFDFAGGFPEHLNSALREMGFENFAATVTAKISQSNLPAD